MNNLLNLLLLSTASLSSINHTNPHGRKNLAAYRDMELADARNMTDDENCNDTTSNDEITNICMCNTTTNNTTTANTATATTTMANNMPLPGNAGSNTNDYDNTMENNTATLNDNIINNETYESIPMKPIFNAEVDALLPNDLMARFVLPPLPYAYDALEPYIDAETMRVHHNRHHQTYVNNLNNAIARYPELYAYTLGQLLTYSDRLPSDVQSAILNNGGGHYNHSFFWNLLSPEANMMPTGTIGSAINREFGSYSNFKRAFTAAALSVFGSGYAWLTLTPGGRLEIITTRNQDTPLPLNLVPLLALDVWEHAYYLNHQSNRDRYIENWFNVINWPYVNSIYEAAIQG